MTNPPSPITPQATVSELKPCPFCGEVPETTYDQVADYRHPKNRCFLAGKGMVLVGPCANYETVDQWNTRTSEVSPPIEGLVASCRAFALQLNPHTAGAVLNQASNALTRLQADNAQLSGWIDNAMRVIEGGYDRKNKDLNAKCEHGRLGTEDCMGCYDEELVAALQSDPTQ